ncbi:MAG: tail fiber domain-containing protein, partial [Bacteroidota bacterium]
QVSSALGSLNNGGTLAPDNATLLLGTAANGLAFDANQIEVIGADLNINANSTRDLHINQGGGDVSIGHNTPYAKLDVRSTNWQFRLNNDAAGGADWYIGSSANSWAVGGGKFVISRTANSNNTVFVIENADQQVGIGTNAPTDRLQVDADAGEDALRVRVAGVTRFRVHDNGGVSIGVNAGPPAEGLLVRGNVQPEGDNIASLGGPVNRWSIVWAANGFIQTSDIRLKTEIEPLDYGLAELLQLQSIRYHWQTNPSGPAKIGFSAQQLYEVMPEVVNGTPDKDVSEAPMGVNYAELVPVLVNAIQEQQEQIDALKAEVETLKQQNK